MYFQIRLTREDKSNRWAFSIFEYVNGDYKCIEPNPPRSYGFIYQSAEEAYRTAELWCLNNTQVLS